MSDFTPPNFALNIWNGAVFSNQGYGNPEILRGFFLGLYIVSNIHRVLLYSK